jgi:transcriptional regulator of acetoin/glycerol metabolism
MIDDDDHFDPSAAKAAVARANATGMPLGALTKPLWEKKTYKDAKAAVMADFEQGYIQALLEEHRGNVSAAARAAGIHRNILHRMMARYGIGR